MVGHKAKSMDAMFKSFSAFLKESIKIFSGLVFEEDILPCVAAQDDMINSARVKDSWFAGHERSIAEKSQIVKPDPNFFDQEKKIS
jgi:hypothetical protein